MRARILIVLLVLGLAACQTAPVKPPPVARPPPAQPLPTLPPIPEPPVSKPVPPLASFPTTAEQVSGGAVTSLMKQARAYRAAGEPSKAAGVLERALRIEPRNYFAWSALGQAYLAQRNYAQAESMALRSNSIARGNLYVELENWKTIAAARQARGDSAGAAQAAVQIEAIQGRLSAASTRP